MTRKSLAATATGLALLASAPLAASAINPNEYPPDSPAAYNFTSGKISPTPGPFPASLTNRAWLKRLAVSLHRNSHDRYAKSFYYHCRKATVRERVIDSPTLRTNVICLPARATTLLPGYDVILWEDGSWNAQRYG